MAGTEAWRSCRSDGFQNPSMAPCRVKLPAGSRKWLEMRSKHIPWEG